MILALCIAVFTSATVAAVVRVAVRTGRRQVAIAPNWWIPLFLKTTALAAVGTGAGLISFQFVLWREKDADTQQMLRRAIVVRQERHSDHTVYELDAVRSGGWSRLNRYDFKLVWEPIALFAAVAGVFGGLIATVIARAVIAARKARPAFPVLDVIPADSNEVESAEAD